MKSSTRRMRMFGLSMLGLVIATILILTAFRDNLIFFYSPSDIRGREIGETRFRLGGIVQENSVIRSHDGVTIDFIITDNHYAIPVTFTGILPDLFREGQGIVAQGYLGSDGIFVAESVLAKHDENYLPPPVARMLDDSQSITTEPQAGMQREAQ